MRSFIDTLKERMKDFTARIDVISIAIQEKEREYSDRLPQVREKLMRDFIADTEKIKNNERSLATDAITAIINQARLFLKVAVVQISTAELEKLEKVFSMGVPSAFELEAIRETCFGSYWGLKYLADRVNDGSIQGILDAPATPDISAYMALFDEIEGACLNTVNAYEGTTTLTGADASTYAAYLILSDSTWENWRLRLDGICSQFLTDTTLLGECLTSNDRKLLNTLIPAGFTETAIKGRIRKLVESDTSDHYKNLFLRSQYAPLAEAVIASMEAEKRNDIDLMSLDAALERIGEMNLAELETYLARKKK